MISKNLTTLNIRMIKPKLHYYDLGAEIVAFSSTRHGGVSRGRHAEFNINRYCSDDVKNVATNREALAEALGLSVDKLIVPHQIHKIESRRIEEEFFTLSQITRDKILDGVDAVMTNVPGVCIGVSTADCIPVLVYDERKRATAAIHAGWRGTLRHIVWKTIREMVVGFGSEPKDLKAVIGPGISIENFEVGQEVYDAFASAGFDMTAIAKQFPAFGLNAEEPEMKWHLDIRMCNQLDLERAGLVAENILDTGICTYDMVDDYFSARRLGIHSGRIYNGIIIK